MSGMRMDDRIVRRMNRVLESLDNGDVPMTLMNAGCLGVRGLAEQNPVALYLARKVNRIVHVGAEPDWWAHALSAPPERDVVASAILPPDVRLFMEDFDAGLKPEFESGPCPKVQTPWGRLNAAFRLCEEKMLYVRCEGDEGVACRMPAGRMMLSDAALAYAEMSGPWACYGSQTWPIAALEMPGAMPLILKYAPVHPQAQAEQTRSLAYHLNQSAHCRAYMRATRCYMAWPDDAVLTFHPPARGVMMVDLVGGDRARVTLSSMQMAVRAQIYPVRLADLERAGDDGV